MLLLGMRASDFRYQFRLRNDRDIVKLHSLRSGDAHYKILIELCVFGRGIPSRVCFSIGIVGWLAYSEERKRS